MDNLKYISKTKQIIFWVTVWLVVVLLLISSSMNILHIIEQNEEQIRQERFSDRAKIIDSAKIDKDDIDGITEYT